MKNIILLFLLFSHNLFSQNNCEIGQLHFEKTVCNDEGNFYVFINFEKVNTSNSFLVLGNGKNYGTFHYEDLPVKIGPLKADCITEYEFLVKDAEFQDCQRFDDLGKNCCTSNCKMYIDSIQHVCHDTKLDLILHASRIDKSAGKYKVKINNEVKGTFDFGTPAEIPDVPVDSFEPVMEIIACLIDTENCCDTFYYINPCFCSITEFKAQVFECNPEDSVFSIKIGFTGTMVGDSFIIGGNNTTYGTYAYNQLPVTISNLPFSNTTFYEFLVLDNSSSFCFGAYELGIVESCDFGCHITHPTVDVFPCAENDSFYVRLKFKENNTSFSGFTVRGNGVSYGHFDYGERFYDIGPLAGNCETIYEFVIQDVESESCHNTIHLEKPVCCMDDCYIREPGITEVCNGDILTSYILNFEHNQDSTKIFELWANGVKLGNYHFGSLPLTLTQIPSQYPIVNFTIVNLSNDNCRKEFTYVFECKKSENHSCNIEIHNIERSECDGENFFIFFSVGGANHGDHGFRVTSPNSNINNEFAYGLARYKIGPFKGDCITKYSFLIQDLAKPDCKEDFTLENPVCCSGDCYIREVGIDEICDGDSLTGYVINFDHNQDSSKIFVLWANNVHVGNFHFGQLPLTISNITFHSQTVVFKIVNQQNEHCRKEISYTFECLVAGGEGCSIEIHNIERSECDGENFFIFFSVGGQNHGDHGFRVTSPNSNINNEFAYGHTRYKIGPFKGDCMTKYSFLFQDLAKPDCKTHFTLENPVCCSGDCFIREVTVDEICDDHHKLKSYVINFDHNQNSDQVFVLWVNNVKIGNFFYSELPISITNITFNTQAVVFKIINLHNEHCRKELSYTFECQVAGTQGCQLLVETFERGDCHSDGTFYLFFKLKATNAGNQGFKVFGMNNVSVNTFEYGLTPYKIGPFEGDCVTKYKFLIKDVAHPDCQTEFGLQEPVCCSEACALDNIRIENTECVNGLLSITINFDHVNTTGSFILKLNGAVRGTYQYQDLPIVIRQLHPTTTYKIIIQDNEKDCIEDFTFTTPECTTSSEDTFFEKIKVYTSAEDLIVNLGKLPTETTNIFVADVLGRVLQKSIIDVEEFRMPMVSYPSGLYLVTVQNGEVRKTFKVFWNR